MNLVIPLFFAAVLVGLFVKKMTPLVWGGLALWVFLNIAYRFLKH